MPKELERDLERRGRKKGLAGERLDAYIYGTMRRLGWRPKRERASEHEKTKKH